MNRFSHTLVASVVMLSLSACTSRTADEYVSSAQKLIEQGDKQAAVIELKNALTLSPDSPDIRLLLGRLYLEQSEFLAAEKEFNKALDLGAAPDAVIPELVAIHYYRQEFGTVINLVESVQLDQEESRSRADLFAYLASLRSADTDDSVKAIPQNLLEKDRLLAEAHYAFVQNNVIQARSKLNELTITADIQVLVDWLKGLIYSREGDYEAASEAYQRVLQTYPRLYTIKFYLAESLINGKELKAAEEVVDSLLKISSENAYANLLKSNILFQQQDMKGALPYAEKAMQNGMDVLKAQIIAGASALKEQKLELAYRYLTKASVGLPSSHSVNRLLAQTQLQLGYTKEAKRLLQKMELDGNVDAGLFSETAMRLAMQGDLEDAKAFFAKANKLDSDNAINQLREGMLKIATDDKAGIANIESAINKDEELKQAWMVLAEAHLRNDDVDAALGVATEWEVKDKASGLALKGLIYKRSGNNEKAVEALNQALVAEPTHVGAHQLLLSHHLENDAYQEALEQASGILNFASTDMRALMSVVQLVSEPEIAAEAFSLLKQHQQQHKNLLSPGIALAMAYRVQNNPDAAIKLLEQKRADLEGVAWMVLGDAYLQQRDIESAKEAYVQWRNETGALPAWLRSIGVEELEGDITEAYSLTVEALQDYSDSEELQLLQLNYLVRLDRSSEAQTKLEKLKGYSSSPLLVRFDGELAFASEDYEKAAQLFEQYYQARPSFESATLLARATQHLDEPERLNKVSEYLELEFSKSENKRRSRHALAEFYRYNKMLERAEYHYLQAFEANRADFVALNNLASIKNTTGQYDEAVSYAERAAEIASNIPQIHDTLGWAYYKNGELGRAEEHLGKAWELAPEDVNIGLNLAEVLARSQKAAEARSLLAKIETQTDEQSKRMLVIRRMLIQ